MPPITADPVASPTRPSSTAPDDSRAPWRLWLASTALFLVFAAVFFGTDAPFSVPAVEQACDAAPPDVRFSSTASEVHGFLDTCGPAGRAAYTRMQVADLVYPAVFALFLFTSLLLVLRRWAEERPALIGLAVLPLLGAAFDYLENLFAWRALATYPDPAATDGLLGIASAAKTTTFWLAGLVLIAAAALLGIRTIHQRLSNHGHPSTRVLGAETP